MLQEPYLSIKRAIERTIPPGRLIHDELRTFAYGTDAGFYRLTPRLVVKVESEQDVRELLLACGRHGRPVTFRAAGTSLAGQAVTDSVLAILGRSWKGIRIEDNGSRVALQPGVVGAHANTRLLPYGRKIGPDPASINAAMIGGIVANNSSGMCCGTAQNSYRTLAGMRLVLADGTVLDTRSADSRARFLDSRRELISRLAELARRTRADEALAARIHHKYRIKNTTGYSLNALIDFEDPIEILAHLMVGSEGTLGFISEVTLETVPELPCKATSLALFPDIRSACAVIPGLKQENAAAVELMDRASLRSVEEKAGMPAFLKELSREAAALLVEARAPLPEDLADRVERLARAIGRAPLVQPVSFTADPAEFDRLWNIRKGLLTSAGAMRDVGTTVIIEDVAFPLERLDTAVADLNRLFEKHGYGGAIVFGHAMDGNLHCLFPQDFSTQAEIRRYERFTDELCRMVVEKYDGSLKAEHGTGRNMAPYVEMEWGSAAYSLMKEIKAIFDPQNILNPGVILNEDPKVHLRNLKPLPPAHPEVDKCIECGFCEVQCPSRDLTLTPRHRITVWREILRLQRAGEAGERRERLRRLFRYQGDDTCAADGLCATACPVGIDTGSLVKLLRSQGHSRLARWVADAAAAHTGLVLRLLRAGLDAAHAVRRTLGSGFLSAASGAARAVSAGRLPRWNPAVPRGAPRISPNRGHAANHMEAVYFPCCVSRTFGPPPGGLDTRSQHEVAASLMRKAGCGVVYPEGLDDLCCGMAFASKGFPEAADRKLIQLVNALEKASDKGRRPILVDTSPCLFRMRESGKAGGTLPLYDPVEFTLEHLAGRLRLNRLPETVAIHATCSSRKLNLAAKLGALAAACAERVAEPEGIGCCGFAGDRGFTVPELNASALRELRNSLPAGCRAGYSTSRTCEIGLSLHSGIAYQSILYLVDEASEPIC